MDYKRFNSLVPQSLLDAVTEALKGGQKKLDVDGDGKLEKSDFEKLRKNKKHEAGETKSQEKAEDMKEGAKEDEPPFEGPYRKPGTRKDEYGNKVKNVAKFLARKAMNKVAKANEEAELSEENVLIHAPGNKHHGKQARVFHKHDDGRVNVQLKHSSKKGDVSNFTLQPNQFTPTEVKEDVVRTGTLAQRSQAYRADKAKKAGANLQTDPDTGTPDHFTAAMRRKKGLPEEAEQIDEISKKLRGAYIKAASHDVATRASATARYAEKEDQARQKGDWEDARKNSKIADKAFNKGWKRRQHIAKAVDKLTAEAATPGVAAGSLPNDEHMCATNIMHKEWKEGQPIPTMHAEPDANGLIEWYDVMFEHGIERVNTADIKILEACSHSHKKMKKEDVELDEARGRGRPSAASKALEDEPVALGMQLRKAKSINKPVTFANKETKQVTGAQIASFNDHMSACRTTQEKAAFQKKCFASYDAFAKAVAVKAGDKPKDTGEVIKYGQ